MIFTSGAFLLFFAVVVSGYYIVPKKLQWIWLLLASYFFYLQSEPVFVIFLIASTLITYSAAMLIGKLRNAQECFLSGHELSKEEKKAYQKRFNNKNLAVCAAGVVLNVGILFYVKYANFFGENIMRLFGGSFSAIDVIVPLGISFYTFQSTGYLMDVYFGTSKPEKNPLRFALFVSFFPQILQGPIAKYGELAPQMFAPHKFDYDKVKSGLLRMLWGFFKKLVIADRAALLVNTVFDNWQDYRGFTVAVAAVVYAVQLYADFSGYMDIAIGAGETLGITMAENFKTPYFSKSIAEFWRRWHITLGDWFRQYLFYPIIRTPLCKKIQKSKKLPKYIKTNLPTVIGLAVVWLTIGFWHGASWKYVFYGIYYGAIIILSMLLKPVFQKLVKVLKINTECFSWELFQIIRTFLIVCLGYIIFRGDGLINACKMIVRMFSEYNPWVFTDGTLLGLGLDWKQWNVLIISTAVLFCVSLANEKGIKVREKVAQQNIAFEWIVYLAGIFAVLIYGIYGPAYDASSFIYFNF
ncbi:MAG: MBOAT family O-acyltransferase [Oscillospiraceae bacterium]